MRDEEPEIGGWKSEVSIRKSPLSRNSCRLRVSARTKLPSSCSSLTESRRRLAARLLRTNFTQITTLRTTCTMNVTCLRITSYVIVPRRHHLPRNARQCAKQVRSAQYAVRSAKYSVAKTKDPERKRRTKKGEPILPRAVRHGNGNTYGGYNRPRPEKWPSCTGVFNGRKIFSSPVRSYAGSACKA